MSFPIKRRATVFVVLCITGLSLGGIAAAAGVSVSLKLKPAYGRAQRTACHRSKSFRLFHRRAVIEARGFVRPAPARHSTVRVELRRCLHGSWRGAGTRLATTKKLTGKFKAFFGAAPLAPHSRRRGAVAYYYARAVALGARSPKVYFAVTS